MLAIVGTVPAADLPIVHGPARVTRGEVVVDGRAAAVNRGTPALIAAAASTARLMGSGPPYAFLVGDIGLGHGSRRLYEFLTGALSGFEFRAIVFHYLQPDVDWHNRVLFAAQDMVSKPALIADAGFMYAAKMSGQSENYDLFTPDIGELAFLADDEAPHPFYTRGFILHENNRVPDLVARAYAGGNAARYLLVKGKTDYLADESGILAEVNGPVVEAMEAIGGTGDTLTGTCAALVDAGYSVPKAALVSAKANRETGRIARPTPASQVADVIRHLPSALEKVLEW